MRGARTHARALPAHEPSFDVFGGFAGHLPSRLAAEGEPCADYSGLHIEPWLAPSNALEECRYARAPTNRQSLGRLNPAVAALSAVAICDASNSTQSSVGALKLPRRTVCLTETPQPRGQ